MVLIREMKPADIDGAAEIESSCRSRWNPVQIRGELQRVGGIHLVATDDPGHTIVGWCCGLAAGDEAELLKLTVAPANRRQGVGSSLLTELCRCWRKKARTIYLEVRSSNAGAAALYIKEGFVPAGRRPDYYSNPVEDALLFKKDL